MESSYDENLVDNNFLQSLIRDHVDELKNVVQNSWIICVPRRDSYVKERFSENDISTHILIPRESASDCSFQSLNGYQVQVKNKSLIVQHDEGRRFSAKLLFEETFYTDDSSKYTVWCIDRPLIHDITSVKDELLTVTCLAECVELLLSELDNKNILIELDSIIKIFEKSHTNIQNESLSEVREHVSKIYSEGLQKVLSDIKIQKKISLDSHFLRLIKMSVESYILYGLKSILQASVSFKTAEKDAEFNKIIRNLCDLKLQTLNMRHDILDGISRAEIELSRLDSFVTILGKAGCLKKAFRHMSEGFQAFNTDDLLPILIFAIIGAGLSNWIAQLNFMKQFRFSCDADNNETDEIGFYIASLEAAIQHIRSNILSNEQNFSILSSVEEKPHDPVSNVINDLFTAVYNCDLEKIEKTLSQILNVSINMELCHPLCRCEKCEQSYMKVQSGQSDISNVNIKDDRGRTALHIACICGHVKIVEFLLMQNGNPNEHDVNGLTPLHYAASRGHQTIVLLLLQANADAKAVDKCGNTPLHLATDRGHDACVKAILYFSGQMRITIDTNTCNIAGDTPLHYASKWGYLEIVEILLEHGANPRIANRKGQIPMATTNNIQIIERLKNHTSILETNTQVLTCRSGEYREKKLEKPKKIQSKDSNKTDKLMAAINNGDTHLACYYLGLEGPHTKPRESEVLNLCHPLCLCEKCESNDEPSDEPHCITALSPNVSNSKGETALHMACKKGLVDLVAILLDAGGNVNAVTTNERRTPLHITCIFGTIEITQLLLRCRTTNVNATDFNGNTPLHLAARNGYVRLVKLLLRHDVDTNIRNYRGFTPLEEIQETISEKTFLTKKFTDIIEILTNQVT